MQQKSLVYICILVINLISSHIVIAAYEDMLEISPATINLGTHILGKKVPLELTITNRGVKPVKITKIKTSCGCVDIKINSSTINVGESIKLHGMVDSLYREGLFEKKIWIMTNAPSNPLYTVMVFGKFKAIDHNLVRFPDYVEVGTANCSSKISRVIEIERNGKVPVGDIKITSSQKWIEVVNLTKESSEIRIKVTVIVPKGINVINEEILVEGNYENDFVRIPVKGIVLPPIRVSPEMVLVTPHKSEYHLAVKTYTNSMAKLVSHDFKGNGLKIMCFKARPERIVVSVDRKKSYKGFAKGKLLLQYEGNAEPIEIIFVSAPLTPSPQRSNNKLSVD